MKRWPHPIAATLGALVLAATTIIAVPVPVPVDARCAPPPTIHEAIRAGDVVVVGTVTAVAQEGRLATVTVEEIWGGRMLPATVAVRGGPGDGPTSVDRTFVAGTRYLFTLGFDADGQLTDSACSSTIEWGPKLEALRPAGAQLPEAAGALDAAVGSGATFDPSGLVVPAGVALLVAVALLIAGLVARGRQTNR